MPITNVHGTVFTDSYIQGAISAARARGVSQRKIDEFLAHNPGDYQRLYQLEPDEVDLAGVRQLGTGQWLTIATGQVSGTREEVVENLAVNYAADRGQHTAAESAAIRAAAGTTLDRMLAGVGLSSSALAPINAPYPTKPPEPLNTHAGAGDAVMTASLLTQGGAPLGGSTNPMGPAVSVHLDSPFQGNTGFAGPHPPVMSAGLPFGLDATTLLVIAAMAGAAFYLARR